MITTTFYFIGQEKPIHAECFPPHKGQTVSVDVGTSVQYFRVSKVVHRIYPSSEHNMPDVVCCEVYLKSKFTTGIKQWINILFGK